MKGVFENLNLQSEALPLFFTPTLRINLDTRSSPFFEGGLRGFLKKKITTKNPPDLPLKREESAKIFYLE